jgi:hypothetical protein
MQKLEGTPVDLSQSIPGFTELKPDIQELLNGIAINTVEVVIEMTLIEQDHINAPLHKASAAGILAEKLARRIIRATQQGASEDQIVSSVTQGFSHAGVE